MNDNEEYACKVFSLALQEGTDRADLPALLERLANELRQTSVQEILDLTFQSDIDDDANDVFSLTVYYR